MPDNYYLNIHHHILNASGDLNHADYLLFHNEHVRLHILLVRARDDLSAAIDILDKHRQPFDGNLHRANPQ